MLLAGPAVSALVLVLAAAAAEIYLRATAQHVVQQVPGATQSINRGEELLLIDTAKGRRQRPGAHVVIRNHYLSHQDVRVDTSSLGLRDTELAKPKPPGEQRILVLGDSVAWGMALQAEETWVQQLEQRLAASSPLPGVQVVNAGIFDAGIHEEVDLLEEIFDAVNPDRIVLAFYLNDSRPPWGFAGELGRRGWLRRSSVLAETIYARFKLWGFLNEKGLRRDVWVDGHDKLDWRGDRQQFLQFAQMASFDWGAAWEVSSWSTVASELQRLRAFAEPRGIAVSVVCFPVAYQVYAGFLEDRPQRMLGALALNLHFTFHDLLPALRASEDPKLYFDQCHPTARGSAVIAESLAGFLTPTQEERRRP